MSRRRRQSLRRSIIMATADGTPLEFQTHNPARCLSYLMSQCQRYFTATGRQMLIGVLTR